MTVKQPPIYALLIGINQWVAPELPPLFGCVHDVQLMEKILLSRFDAQPEHLVRLQDSEATHLAIISAFREHLVEKAKEHAGLPANQAPAFLFYYAGHGSRAVDSSGTQPNGLDESIVPYDSRTDGIWDLRDWELGQLIDELAEYSENISVILDCCHAGSGTRDEAVRTCPPDTRPQATTRPVVKRKKSKAAARDDNHTLLAACAFDQVAKEYTVDDDGEEYKQGAMTYFLARELGQLSRNSSITYRELHNRLSHAVRSYYGGQTPQCEGDRDRILFGGIRPPRVPLMSVTDIDDKGIWLDAGATVGLNEGELLNVYPPGTRLVDDSVSIIGQIRLDEVHATKSLATAVGDAKVPLHSQVAVRIRNPGSARRVFVDRDMPELLSLMKRADNNVYIRHTENRATANFLVTVDDESSSCSINDPADRVLASNMEASDPAAVVNSLVCLSRYFNTLDLKNPDASDLAGDIHLQLHQVVEDPAEEGDQQLVDEKGKPMRNMPPVTPVATTKDGIPIAEIGKGYALEIRNDSEENLYCGILNFSYDYSISVITPEFSGSHKQLSPGKSMWIGRGRKRSGAPKPLRPTPAKNDRKLFTQAREFFKVIVSREPADFEVLQQPPIHKRKQTATGSGSHRAASHGGLNSTLTKLAGSQGTRAMLMDEEEAPPADWAVANLEYLMVRSEDDSTHTIQNGTATSIPELAITIQGPDDFSGSIRIENQDQTRAASEEDTQPIGGPRGFSSHPRQFTPFVMGGDRNTGALVIQVAADAMSCATITKESPLRMTLEAPVESPLIVVARDGDFYHAVGRSNGSGEIVVESLPALTEDMDGATATRSTARTIKLYVYRVLGWPEPGLGLHSARFISKKPTDDVKDDDEFSRSTPNGEVRFHRIRKGELKSEDRVALLVHGFQSDTDWMVDAATRISESANVSYDHLLTFNYESIGARIEDNAKQLASLLAAAGFGADDGYHLDIIAHSMGTLVTRAFIELHGGNSFVDRCLLAGPPNLGTKLAEITQLVPSLVTTLLNKALPIPPTLLGDWSLGKIACDSLGPQDLRPSSSFLKKLNGANSAVSVPYFILAGTNRMNEEEEQGWRRHLQQLRGGIDTALEWVFDGDHDLVIGLNSMLTVREGRFPLELLETRTVPCDHFDYLSSPESIESLIEFLQGDAYQSL